MKKGIAAAALVLVVAGAATAQARVDFNVNIDVPVAPVVPVVPVPRPAVVTYQAAAPQFVVDEAPQFIYSRDLGFYVSVGSPYDMTYVDNCYYVYRGGTWYMSSSYRGPWSAMRPRMLPRELRRHRYEEIRHFRDNEYRTYLHDREHYRGMWHRPGAVPVAAPGYRWEDRKDRWDDRRGDRDRNWDGRRDNNWDGRRGHWDDRR